MTDVNEQIPSYSFSFLHAFFFSWSWVVLLLFFFLFFSFHAFFFFFSFGVALFPVLDISPFSFWGVSNLFLFLVSFPCFLFSSSVFGVGLFSFFFLGGGAEFVLLDFGLSSLFLIFWGPCFFSLSPSITWTSRSEIDSSLFLAAFLIVSVEPWQPSRKPYHETYAQVLAPNNHMYHIRN